MTTAFPVNSTRDCPQLLVGKLNALLLGNGNEVLRIPQQMLLFDYPNGLASIKNHYLMVMQK